jgi:hypothetical protein
VRLLAVTTLVLAAAALGAPPAGAPATIQGSDGPDRLRGTRGADALYGGAGNDRLNAGAGDDFVHGGLGRDVVVAGRGNDRVAVQADELRDVVRCGTGRDIVNAEASDAVARDCEVVSRQLSRTRDIGGQRGTEVEPDSSSQGSRVVTAFQVGRFEDGGAAAIGFATSDDAGRSWRSGLLPGVTHASRPRGDAEAASDPTVAYDGAHRLWLVVSLALLEDGRTHLLVSRSQDGRSWQAPVVAADSSADEDFDKEWLVCDNWPTSRFRGRCYLSYLNVETSAIATRTSSDGGLTWSAPVVSGAAASRGFDLNGAQPVVQPDGTLVVLYVRYGAFAEQILAARSRDGGAIFEAPVPVSDVEEGQMLGIRAPVLPSADVDPSGRIHVVWHDCRFRLGCDTNGIVLATSLDGRSWSHPVPLPVGDSAQTDYFLPAVAAEPGPLGSRTRLAVTYYSMRSCGFATCPEIDASALISRAGTAAWGAPQRLSAQSMQLPWIAATNVGRMLGDYFSVSFAGRRIVPVFAVASRRRLGFRQGIFAARLPR